MTDGSAMRSTGSEDLQPAAVHDQAGDSNVTGLAEPAAGPDQDEVEVLYLAGQRPPPGGTLRRQKGLSWAGWPRVPPHYPLAREIGF